MTLQQQIASLADSSGMTLLSTLRSVGLEREAMRVVAEGQHTGLLAQTKHPQQLGSALTHPYITTDYSEAQIELITPPLRSTGEAQDFLQALLVYVSHRLDKEILWGNSMPCVMQSGQGVPIAQYGHSNAGRMRTLYRKGLGFRYGRAMQAISGVHFNYSFNPQLWARLAEQQDKNNLGDGCETFQTQAYLGMIRNILRNSWVVPYLFGSSPAICKAFLDSAEGLVAFDESTMYAPYGTSLRMGDIGYQNNEGVKGGIKVSYDSLQSYVDSLRYAVSTPYAAYAHQDDTVAQQQLNTNILQIENEYYATARPKNTPTSGEMPILALHRRGIEYVELRTVDINPFEATGTSQKQLDFLEAFFVWCLLDKSEPLPQTEQTLCARNEVLVAHYGRDPKIKIKTQNGQLKTIADRGNEIVESMQAVCELLDQAHNTTRYCDSLREQQSVFTTPELTPSARMVREMRGNNEGFVEFTLRQSSDIQERMMAMQEDKKGKEWDYLAKQSQEEQEQKEANDTISLQQYISDYFNQLQQIDALTNERGK